MSNLFAGAPLPKRFDPVQPADLTGVQFAARVADIRDREMERRFELAQELRRQDINTLAGYDLAAIGQFRELVQPMVAELSEELVNGDLNAVEARARVQEVGREYNRYKTGHFAAIKPGFDQFKSIVTDPKEKEAFEEANYAFGETITTGLDDYYMRLDIATNRMFEPGSLQVDPVTGQRTVVDLRTGMRVVPEDLTGFGDPSAFVQYATEMQDMGTLLTWAKDKATQDQIKLNTGNWTSEDAETVYRFGLTGQEKNSRTHRIQALATVEEINNISISDFLKRAFMVADINDLQKEIVSRDGRLLISRKEYEGLTDEQKRQYQSDSGKPNQNPLHAIYMQAQESFLEESKFPFVEPRDPKDSGSGSTSKKPVYELADAIEFEGASTVNLQTVTALGDRNEPLSQEDAQEELGLDRPLSEVLTGVKGWTYTLRALRDQKISLVNPNYVLATSEAEADRKYDGEFEPFGPLIMGNLKLDRVTFLENGSVLITNASNEKGNLLNNVLLRKKENKTEIIQIMQAIQEAYALPQLTEELMASGEARKLGGLEINDDPTPSERPGGYLFKKND
jgi:hypothetical protein